MEVLDLMECGEMNLITAQERDERPSHKIGFSFHKPVAGRKVDYHQEGIWPAKG